MIPSIPQKGLAEALEGWSSKGELWQTLAAIPSERDWSWRDSERRAMRVLLAELADLIEDWPTLELEWIEALPAVSHRVREVSPVPGSGVSWAATRLRGWPPSEFVSRPKARVADQLLVASLRWTIERLALVRISAEQAAPDVSAPIRAQLDTAERLLDVEPVASAPAIAPSEVDLTAIAAEGRPWAQLSPVTAALLALEEATVLDLARRLVAPTEERWRLFHLGVFGEVLRALRDRGHVYRSLRPLSATSSGPAFEVVDTAGQSWDLWFEAAGAWKYHGVCDPYADAVAGVPGAGSALGCDVALMRFSERAMLLDAKYSANAAVVGRDGYRAALAYAAEARSGLADEVVSVAVGPTEVVQTPGWTLTDVGQIGVIAPDHLGHALARLFDRRSSSPRAPGSLRTDRGR
ncbi:hypothetical protein [Conexibacter arvalis]|uniref:Uncharacterized protein n=1 Tax=Conexibacter arvalis TaxID=912552 RepID=A0A840IE48_9ACTN|nr:hypothetical protein [Conexibacter arvalis]MBB4663076.1 hypothetical protein [Conexibacter arvalis]